MMHNLKAGMNEKWINTKQDFKNLPQNLKIGCTAWSLITVRRGDIDAFAQLVMNNIGTTLVVASLLYTFFDPRYNSAYTTQYTDIFIANPQLVTNNQATILDYVFSRTVVGLALSIVFGSVYYTWLALRLRAQDPATLRTTLPFGVNTPAAFAFTLNILMPMAASEFNACYLSYKATPNVDALNTCLNNSIDSSWKAGVLSNFVAGLIGAALSFIGNFIVKVTPRVALLVSLGTIGIAFLLLSQICLNYADPLTGILPVGLMILGFFCGVQYWKISTTFVVVIVGAGLSWATGISKGYAVSEAVQDIRWTPPTLGVSALGNWNIVSKYFGTIFPFAIQAAVGTLMNCASALKAGDDYPVIESMVVDGIASMVGAIFGTPLMTSVYIGHPGFKSMGATTSYSLMCCALYLLLALIGMFAFINTILPPSSLAPVIAFIGLIICADAMDGIPSRHNVVFVYGLLPGICDWAVQNGMFASGTSQWGYLALGGPNAMFYAMVICSVLAFATDRNFLMALGWTIFAAACSAIGLIHQDTVGLNQFSEPHGFYCIPLLLNGEQNPQASSAWTNLSGDPYCLVNYVLCENNTGCGFIGVTQWRFMTSYLMLAVPFVILHFLQNTGKFSTLERCDTLMIQNNESEPVVELQSTRSRSASDITLERATESHDNMASIM